MYERWNTLVFIWDWTGNFIKVHKEIGHIFLMAIIILLLYFDILIADSINQGREGFQIVEVSAKTILFNITNWNIIRLYLYLSLSSTFFIKIINTLFVGSDLFGLFIFAWPICLYIMLFLLLVLYLRWWSWYTKGPNW